MWDKPRIDRHQDVKELHKNDPLFKANTDL